MATESYAVLTISSRTLSSEQIGSHVGLEADKARNTGEQRVSYERYGGGPIHGDEARWAVRSTLARGEPIEAHIDNLSERIKPVAQAIRGLADDNTVTFACVIYVYAEDDLNPEVFLSRSTVELLSALGANFWVDTYFLADGEGTHIGSGPPS